MPVTASDGIHETDVTDDSMRIAGLLPLAPTVRFPRFAVDVSDVDTNAARGGRGEQLVPVDARETEHGWMRGGGAPQPAARLEHLGRPVERHRRRTAPRPETQVDRARRGHARRQSPPHE